MPAWEIKKLWSDSVIAAYRTFVSTAGPKKSGVLRSTCEDLAIRLVSEFAASEGLPLEIKNESNKDGIIPRKFANLEEFLDSALTSTGARDLANFNTVKFVAGTSKGLPSSLAKAKSGDLILLYDPIHHVQVVTSTTATEVKIAQGNFRPESEQAGTLRKVFTDVNQNRPSDSYYIGQIVAQFSHVFDPKAGTWLYNGRELFKDDSGRLMIWDFDAWNDLVVKHTVAKDETLSSIALKVLKNGNLWTRIYESNKGVIGADSNKVRPGMTLFIWKK
ncbi:LysM peptidoglycan-binding domain-containing protein [Limnoglobus roseus]|uniref:LysM domain-containing protein n=1 Tax=Limnoglobus roseus TaxID=2598579 RepID=A0A5C1ANN2_9BACT|nr:LysM peptidoglycan-binding domain-containing protein [Limnoglobus roseus]QEL19733.1 hypothetical protein PX52LOC_06812 [Limnoglobus roseus]